MCEGQYPFVNGTFKNVRPITINICLDLLMTGTEENKRSKIVLDSME